MERPGRGDRGPPGPIPVEPTAIPPMSTLPSAAAYVEELHHRFRLGLRRLALPSGRGNAAPGGRSVVAETCSSRLERTGQSQAGSRGRSARQSASAAKAQLRSMRPRHATGRSRCCHGASRSRPSAGGPRPSAARVRGRDRSSGRVQEPRGHLKRDSPPFCKALQRVRHARIARGRQPATRVLRVAPALRVTAAADRADCS